MPENTQIIKNLFCAIFITQWLMTVVLGQQANAPLYTELNLQLGKEETVSSTYTSPDGHQVVAVTARDAGLGPNNPPFYTIGSLTQNVFTPYKEAAESRFNRETHGSAWFDSATPNWIDNRFLVFQDRIGLAIMDTLQQQILINNDFPGYSKSPIANEWVAVRFRPTTRHQEYLDQHFADTLLFLDPLAMAQNIARSTEQNPLGQTVQIVPGGIIQAPPVWSEDGKTVAILTWNHGVVQVVAYDANTHKEKGRVTVNADISNETALSTGFSDQINSVANVIIKRSGLLDYHIITNIGDAVPLQVPKKTSSIFKQPKPTPLSEVHEKSTSSKLWLCLLVSALLIAMICLALKHNSK